VISIPVLLLFLLLTGGHNLLNYAITRQSNDKSAHWHKADGRFYIILFGFAPMPSLLIGLLDPP